MTEPQLSKETENPPTDSFCGACSATTISQVAYTKINEKAQWVTAMKKLIDRGSAFYSTDPHTFFVWIGDDQFMTKYRYPYGHIFGWLQELGFEEVKRFPGGHSDYEMILMAYTIYPDKYKPKAQKTVVKEPKARKQETENAE